MEKSIYNVYVVMDSQATCDRMKQLCIDNGLPYWKSIASFQYIDWFLNCFSYDIQDNEFYCFDVKSAKNIIKTQVTESEFIELLKTTK